MADLMKLMEENLKDPKFSFKQMREACMRMEQNGKLKEAIGETTFGQLLRYGVQLIANNWYKVVPTVYPDIVQEVTSGGRQEWYAPLYRGQLPKQVDKGGMFEESTIKGVDRELVNLKFGRIESFERELFDDDQTGQIRQRAGYMGENMKIMEEIYATARLTGAALTEADVTVNASNYTTTTLAGGSYGVYSTQVGNMATWLTLSQPALEDANIALKLMRDPLGNKMLVLPNTLVVATDLVFNAAKLLNSGMQPSVPGVLGGTVGGAISGTTGWTEAINPLKGLFTLKEMRFLPLKSWYLGEAKKGLVFQRRDALEVVQELPATGQSFEQDAYRFRTRSRWECDWIESRFWFQGNDGSV